jgi:uncharacterized protein (TIGR03000 family)
MRITVHDEPAALTLQPEGRLTGPWVRVLEECWQNAPARQRRPRRHVDLRGVTFIDDAGEACLAALHRQGAEFVAADCLMQAVVAEMTRPGGTERFTHRKSSDCLKRSDLAEDDWRWTMRSVLSASVLGIAVLGLAATLPSQACARPPAWYGWRPGGYGWHGGWGGPYRYGPRVVHSPYANYYGPYAYYYPPYAYYTPYTYYPPPDYSVSRFYSVPDAEFSTAGSAAAALPHPTGGVPVAPADAGLIQLRIPDKFAEVTFNGQAVSSVGTTRDYVTPPLQVGQTYHYTIAAAWGRGDQQTARQQTIDIARGQTRSVDFSAVPNGSPR